MTTTSTATATAQAIAGSAHTFAEEAPAMTATAAPTAPIVYRPLNPALGDADALAELRAIRAARAAGYEHSLRLAQAADARERAHRDAARRDHTNRRHKGGRFWGLLPA